MYADAARSIYMARGLHHSRSAIRAGISYATEMSRRSPAITSGALMPPGASYCHTSPPPPPLGYNAYVKSQIELHLGYVSQSLAGREFLIARSSRQPTFS
jgi:hypothetical protein